MYRDFPLAKAAERAVIDKEREAQMSFASERAELYIGIQLYCFLFGKEFAFQTFLLFLYYCRSISILHENTTTH
jgi:hypothetical protein